MAARTSRSWFRRGRAPRLGVAARVVMSAARRRIPGLDRAVVAHDQGHSRIEADLKTALGLGLYRYGVNTPELELVRRCLSRGDTFVEGGANVGVITLVAAAAVGAAGRVLAFEPAERTRASLQRNVELNGFHWVDIRPEALAERVGQSTLFSFGGDAKGVSSFAPADPGQARAELVPLTTLDEVLFPFAGRVKLIKLDLEGAEARALAGANGLLRAQRPDLILELEDPHLSRQGSSASAVLSILASHGYRVFRILPGPGGYSLVPIEDFPAARMPVSPEVFATAKPVAL
jgi:FkbM family methyltransferase